MEIFKIDPIGFCSGVHNAYKTIFEILKKHSNSKIYMIGWLVHNKKVIEIIQNNGIVILDDATKTRYQLIDQLDDDLNNVIIFSAHGTDQKTIALAKQKFKYVYNLICPFVSKTFDLIKKYSDLNYKIVYFGKNNHPESAAAKCITSNFVIVENENDLSKITDNSNIFYISQTTVNYNDFEKSKDYFKDFKHKVVVSNEICSASRLRQQTIQQAKNFDMLFLLGDKKSNNSNTLYKTAINEKINVHFIESAEDIDFNWFEGISNCAIISATSCSNEMVGEIIDFINKNIK